VTATKRWFGVMALALLVPGVPALVASDPAVTSTAERAAGYAHLMLAVGAARRGEFAAASDEIDRALAAQPDDADLLVESAELLSWTGRPSQAERHARQALEIDPQHEAGLRFLADLLLTRALASADDIASRQEATLLLERLAARDPSDSEVLGRLAQLRHRAGDLPAAIEAARQVVALTPGDATATRSLAQLLLQAKEEREALDVLLNYVGTHPETEDLALFAEQLAHNLEAWPRVVEVLEASPVPITGVVSARLLGESYLRSGRAKDAARTLELARDQNPQDLRVRNNLALAYRSQGRMADASALFAEMVAESPDFPSFRQLLAETLEIQGDAEGALAAYATALEAWGDAPDAAPVRDAVRQRMALLELGRGSFAAARTMLGSVENPEGTLSVRIAGRIAVESGDWAEVRRTVRKLRALEEPGLGALLEGEALVLQKRWGKAESAFAEALELLGSDVRRRIAEIYRTAARPEVGLELLQSWVASEPENADARFLLGEYLYLLDRFDAADPELRAAFRLEPSHAPALNFLGYSYAERNTRLDEALDLIGRALAIDEWNGAYLDSLGWTYFQLGRYADARDPLERAAREMPKDPTILEHLGDVYSRLGDEPAALSAWQRALEAGPEDPLPLREKLGSSGQPPPGEDGTPVADGEQRPADPSFPQR
jgi:tetratricopeptide (TPR) repeat protein